MVLRQFIHPQTIQSFPSTCSTSLPEHFPLLHSSCTGGCIECYHGMVLLRIFLMINAAECLFMCSLAIWIYTLLKQFFMAIAWFFFLLDYMSLLHNFKSSAYILSIRFYSHICNGKNLFPFCEMLFNSPNSISCKREIVLICSKFSSIFPFKDFCVLFKRQRP